ncbi:hypothetical protein, partial [Acetobacter pomorum]|uniref:hypothetical protein n=1 Tax=Acetobacter pomorum TaxID=65959 RepID=UPI00222F2969
IPIFGNVRHFYPLKIKKINLTLEVILLIYVGLYHCVSDLRTAENTLMSFLWQPSFFYHNYALDLYHRPVIKAYGIFISQIWP